MTKKKNHGAEKTAKLLEIIEADPSSCSLSEQLSFCSLPNELQLSIVEKHTDLNFLFQFALVSKYFTSVVSQVQAVSFTIPSSGDVSIESQRKLLVLVEKVNLPSSEQDLAIREFLSSQNLNLPTFLGKLPNVKSIHLEYVSPEEGGMLNLLSPRWKVKFNDSGKTESSAALLAESVCMTEDDPSNEILGFPELVMSNKTRARLWIPYMRYVEWMCLTYLLVKDHTSLELVTIIDSDKQNKLVSRGKELLKFRTSVPLELLKKPVEGHTVKMAKIPVMHLPLSGLAMRWVVLQLATSDDVPDAVPKLIEDDNSVLAEAIKEIFKNHAHKIRSIPNIWRYRWC